MPATHAAGQGHGGDARIVDGAGDAIRGHVQHFEHAFRQAGILEQLSHQVGAAHYVRCVLEHVGVTRQNRRHGAAQHLPDREVPRHHGQDRAQRAVFDTGFFDLGRLGGEHGRAVLGVPAAKAYTLADFTASLGDRLANFAADHVRESFSLGFEGVGQGQQVLAALTQRHLAPLAVANLGALQRRFQCGVGVERVGADLLAAVRVEGDGVGQAADRAHGGTLSMLLISEARLVGYGFNEN